MTPVSKPDAQGADSRHGPIIPNQWVGGDDGDEWEMKIDHDHFGEGEGFVVCVDVENHGDKTSALACLSPSEAREAASALMVYAFMADKAQRDLEQRQAARARRPPFSEAENKRRLPAVDDL